MPPKSRIQVDTAQLRGALTGKVVGSYQIEKLIGKGGMGEVYLARHSTLERKVAIKVLSSRCVSTQDWLARFRREAQLLAQLEHPNAVRVYDYGQTHQREYLVMEYVEGKDLAEVLEQRGRMRVTDALAITKRVCSALAAAHAMGIVHRDIKPANILITHEKVKVADFGLSRHLDGDSHMTQPGHIMGTPHYMSPEQCMGLPLDVRTDLYSVGASLYHMLAGRVPYTANTPIGVLQMHVDQDTHPEPLRQIDPELPQSVADVVTRLMGHQPSDRFSTAREAAEAIDVVLRSVRGTAPPPKPVVPWLFYACVAAALVVGLSLAFQFNRSPRKAPTTSGENKTTMPDGEPRAPKIDRPSDQPTVPVKAEIDEAIQRVSQLVLNSPTELKEILSALGAIEQKYGEQAPAERIEKIRQEARESSLRARAEAYFSALVSRDWQKAATFLSRSSPDGQSVENKAEGLKWRANRRQKWHGGSAHTFQIINARADLDGTALVEFIVKSLDGTQMEPRVRSNSWQLKDHVWLLKLGKHHR